MEDKENEGRVVGEEGKELRKDKQRMKMRS